MTSSTRVLYNIRHKENKTEEDELLLNYRRTLASISNILVSQSKGHIEDEYAIEKIRELTVDSIY